MSPYKEKSVILKSYNLGEADRIIKLYTQNRGMIDSIAKGARKIKSKFGGRLELFNFVDLEISEGRNLDIIIQAELIKHFSSISSDFNKFLFCQLISEIILKTNLEEAENAPVIFKLVYACFNEIDLASSSDIYSIKKTGIFFISKFLKITGYSPLISVCCRCGLETEKVNSQFFSIKSGGMLCRKCSSAVENSPDMKKALSVEKFDFISSLFSAGLKDYRKIDVKKEDLDDVICMIGDYMRYYTGCDIDVSLYLKEILP